MRTETNLKTGKVTTHKDAPITYVPPTAQEIDEAKTAQVEAELGSDVVRIIIETIVPMIQDGSITNKTPDDVIAQAKANRRAEL